METHGLYDKFGIPETLEAFANAKIGTAKFERFMERNPDIVKVAIFARERWVGLKSPVRIDELMKMKVR